MKVIVYKINSPVNTGNDEAPVWVECLYQKTIPYSADAEEIAKSEAYNGEYTIEDNGDPEVNTVTLEDRVQALERAAVVPEYEAGKWYYRGDKMTFDGSVYTCIAPAGVVCVWSPTEYPEYWNKEE